mmetsp:Transcript_58451/g.131691  ORF Transcript_58451/g.131691 Transcript_58451/m.131691 type:complete len:261 (+) Transcript_58451:64-846(+)
MLEPPGASRRQSWGRLGRTWAEAVVDPLWQAESEQQHRHDDKNSARDEEGIEGNITEQGPGENVCEDDGSCRAEAPDCCSSILEHDCAHEASEGVHEDHTPDNPGVALEEPVVHDGVTFCLESHGQAGERAEEAKLHVAHPDGDVGLSQHLLRVDACEAARHAGEEDRQHTLHVVAAEDGAGVPLGRLRLLRAPGPLHHRHAHGEHEAGIPLLEGELPAQNQHAEASRGYYLHLVEDLLHGRADLRQTVERQVVVHTVDE